MNFWKTVGKVLLSIIIVPVAAVGGFLTGIVMAIGLFFALPLIVLGDIWEFDI